MSLNSSEGRKRRRSNSDPLSYNIVTKTMHNHSNTLNVIDVYQQQPRIPAHHLFIDRKNSSQYSTIYKHMSMDRPKDCIIQDLREELLNLTQDKNLWQSKYEKIEHMMEENEYKLNKKTIEKELLSENILSLETKVQQQLEQYSNLFSVHTELRRQVTNANQQLRETKEICIHRNELLHILKESKIVNTFIMYK